MDTYQTDARYWFLNSDDQEQQIRPVNVYFRLFLQDRTFISPALEMSFSFTILTPSRTMIQELTPTPPPQNKNTNKGQPHAHKREIVKEREERCQDKVARGKGRTGWGNTGPLQIIHTEPKCFFFLGDRTYLKKLSQDGNTIPMFSS